MPLVPGRWTKCGKTPACFLYQELLYEKQMTSSWGSSTPPLLSMGRVGAAVPCFLQKGMTLLLGRHKSLSTPAPLFLVSRGLKPRRKCADIQSPKGSSPGSNWTLVVAGLFFSWRDHFCSRRESLNICTLPFSIRRKAILLVKTRCLYVVYDLPESRKIWRWVLAPRNFYVFYQKQSFAVV